MAHRKRFWSRSGRSRSSRSRSSSYLKANIYRAIVLAVLLVCSWGAYRVVQYAYGHESLAIRNVQVRGERRVSESAILSRVGDFPGSNLMALRLDEIRENVESLDWIRHATVHRVWPNELAISVVEREAVALVRIDGLVVQADADGVILPLDPGAKTDMPILDGLSASEAPEAMESNAVRIAVYRRVLEELDGDQLSEVHVGVDGGVSVVPIDDPVVVELGVDEHGSRWARYQALKERIHEDFPEASRIDLRFKDQVIIQMDEQAPAEQIIWGDETKLL